jgi:IclR family transcriptional regulator, acetate operon repressor
LTQLNVRPAVDLRGGVQSVERAFELLETLADNGGVAGLSQLAAISGLPVPTVHRLLRTLVDGGWIRQEPSREYGLGPRLIKVGESASQLVGSWATPLLAELVDGFGESANLAMLEGNQVVYVAQAPGRHSMRMFTEVGRRAGLHCTAVGKAMLAELPRAQAIARIQSSDLTAYTPNTITTEAALLAELDLIHERGYAVDEGEQEVGVRCVAVALPGAPTRAAVSVSGPLTRVTDEQVESAVPLLVATASKLASELRFVGNTRTQKN